MSREDDLEAFVDQDGADEAVGLPSFLLDPIGVLKRRWKWMAVVLVIGLSATVLYLRDQRPTYLARATVLVTSQRISEEFFRPTVESDQLEKMSAIVGELLSRQKLASMIQKHNLYPDPEEGEPLTFEEKVELMRENIVLGPDETRGTNSMRDSSAVVYEFTYRYYDPQLAADVTNELASGFNDTHLRIRSRQARLTTEFLQRELKQVEQDLADLDHSIAEFKQRYRGELPSELRMSLGRLDRLQSQRQSLALQIAEAETRLANLAATGEDVDRDSPESRLRALKLRYEQQRILYTADHPNIVSIERQIDVMEGQLGGQSTESRLDANASTAAGAARITLSELHRQLDATVRQYDELDRRVGLMPMRQEELAGMEQRAEIYRESYREFRRKVNQAELAEAVESSQQGERATILDAAVPPAKTDSSALKMAIVMVMATFALAGGIGVLLEMVDAVIIGASEIEQQYRLPVLGSIGRIQ